MTHIHIFNFIFRSVIGRFELLPSSSIAIIIDN